MAFNQEVISWQKNTVSVDDHTQVISLAGSFTPKVVVIMTEYIVTLGDASTESVLSIGVSDVTNNYSIHTRVRNALSTMDTYRSHRDDCCAHLVDGTGGVQDKIQISAFSSGSFTVQYTDNDSAQRRYTAFVFGGDDLEYEIKEFQNDTTSGAHRQDITTTLKSADFGLFFGVSETTKNPITATANSNAYIGVASSPTKRGSVWIASEDGVTTSDTYSWLDTAKCIMRRSSLTGAASGGADLNEFDATDGIRLDWDADKNTSAYYNICLLLKGIDVDVGNDTTKITTTGEKETSTAIDPESLFLISNLHSGSESLGEHRIGVGMADDSEEAFCGQMDKDNEPDAETRRIQVTDHVIIGAVADDPIPATDAEGNMATVPFETGKFTIDYTKVDATARTFVWAVFAEKAAVSARKLYSKMYHGQV